MWTRRHQKQADAMRVNSSEAAELPQRVVNVLRISAIAHNVRVKDVLSNSRFRPVVRARKNAASQLRSLNLSTPLIAQFLNLKHHSTVLYYLNPDIKKPKDQRVKESYDYDKPDESGIWAI